MTRRFAILLCAGFLLAPIAAPSGVAFAGSDADLKAAIKACKKLAGARQKDECVSKANERHGPRSGGKKNKNDKRDK